MKFRFEQMEVQVLCLPLGLQSEIGVYSRSWCLISPLGSCADNVNHVWFRCRCFRAAAYGMMLFTPSDQAQLIIMQQLWHV